MRRLATMRLWWLVPVIILSTLAFTADTSVVKREAAAQCGPERIRLTPRRDRTSPTGIYIPTDLDDAFAELDRLLPACFIQQLRTTTEWEMNQHHLGIGMWLRNYWWLWHGSELARYFRGIGIVHPDDMSGILLTSYWRRLHEQPVNVDSQAAIYRAYWRLFGRQSDGRRIPDKRDTGR